MIHYYLLSLKPTLSLACIISHKGHTSHDMIGFIILDLINGRNNGIVALDLVKIKNNEELP